MKHIVIASHHRFATGLKETLTFLTTLNHIVDISAYVEENAEPLEDTVRKVFEQFDPQDKVIIMTDMLSGSVNQKFVPYINDHVFLVTGINVPLALTFHLADEDMLTAEYIRSAVEEAKQTILFVNDVKAEDSEEDE